MRKSLMGFLIFILIFGLIGCRSQEVSNEREIYIPILADAAWLNADGSFLHGVQLAVEEVNSEYSGQGYQTTTEVIDDQALYEKGVEMASILASNPRVTAVLNLQNFDVSKTTADILSGSGELVLFPYGAYDSLFNKDNPLVFSGVPSFADLGKAMADYAVAKGYQRIAVYHNGAQSQEELVSSLELTLLNSSAKIVDYVPSIASVNDFDRIYSRWQALDVDCVVIAQYGLERAFEVLDLIRSRDQELPVIGEPIFNRANALAVNKEIAEGMVVPSTLVLEDSEKLKSFQKRYRERFGQEADIWAVQGYDMLRLVVDNAVRLDTNDPAKIAAALREEKGYQGVGRYMAFTEGGALVVDVGQLPILVCKDGSFR